MNLGLSLGKASGLDLLVLLQALDFHMLNLTLESRPRSRLRLRLIRLPIGYGSINYQGRKINLNLFFWRLPLKRRKWKKPIISLACNPSSRSQNERVCAVLNISLLLYTFLIQCGQTSYSIVVPTSHVQQKQARNHLAITP